MTYSRNGWVGHLLVTRYSYNLNTSREPRKSYRTRCQGTSTFQIITSQNFPTPLSHHIQRNHSTSNCRPARLSSEYCHQRHLNPTNGIYKFTATNQSSNQERCCTFLTHTGIKNTLLDKTPQGDNTTQAFSFAAPVQRKQFGATRKQVNIFISRVTTDSRMKPRVHRKS